MLTACTVFSPSPSIAEMIMHEFGMRSDCQDYNLSGQGSSAGVMLVSLARDLLTVKLSLVLAHTSMCLPCSKQSAFMTIIIASDWRWVSARSA